jgi:hypothetical protein
MYKKSPTKLQSQKPGEIESLIQDLDKSTKHSSKHSHLCASEEFSNPVLRDKHNFIQFCSPNCLHKHEHNHLYDYSKNHHDPLSERPGIDFYLNPKVTVEQAK